MVPMKRVAILQDVRGRDVSEKVHRLSDTPQAGAE
jgi:hypothetical protein